MINKVFKYIKDSLYELIVYDFKYLMCLFLVAIICMVPVNYYVIVGGGISDIKSRVQIKNGYDSKGSFNISYVTESDGRLITYLLSYVFKDWERISIDNYKYNEEEKIEDINFRSELDLKKASSDAIKVAYSKAGKKIKIKNTHTYVYAVGNEYKDCKLQVGDEILQLDGKDFANLDYSNYINSLNEGDLVTFKVKRNNKIQNVNTKIYKRKDKLLIGIMLETVNDYEASPKPYIKFKEHESGPSGGLMTALSIYNQLVQKDITNGLKIAGTGTIDSNGKVGPIGGVKYKLMGAVAGDADIFIVPDEENYKEVMKLMKKKKYDIKIINVKTFDEAVNKLNNFRK